MKDLYTQQEEARITQAILKTPKIPTYSIGSVKAAKMITHALGMLGEAMESSSTRITNTSRKDRVIGIPVYLEIKNGGMVS